MKPLLYLLAILLSSARAQNANHASFGYSLTLPTRWERVVVEEYQHEFRDTARVYPAVLSITGEKIDRAEFPSPESWVRARYAAYLYDVEFFGGPHGETVYYDSSASAKLGQLWAPEAFSVYDPDPAMPLFGEYVRFCAVEGFGYRIAALGDSADMAGNIDYYAGLLSAARFVPAAPAILSAPARMSKGPRRWGEWFDIRGRWKGARLPAFSPRFGR